MARSTDLTKGNITRGLWGFALPLMLGNVLQQLYNLVDTWVVGRYVGDNALAADGRRVPVRRCPGKAADGAVCCRDQPGICGQCGCADQGTAQRTGSI